VTVRAVITSGDGFETLPFANLATEVRVEQELSKPTRFAVRFTDHLCNGSFEVSGATQIKANTPIAIFARVGARLECLVYGPVGKVRTSSMIGGTGSWVEIHGEDQRVIMGRIGVDATWTGYASDAAKRILSAHGFHKHKVQTTTIKYDEKKHKLGQRATDLAFLEDIARKNNLEFWLTYDVAQAAGANLDAVVLTCTPEVHIEGSPPQGDFPQPPRLSPNAGRVINVQPPLGECARVTRFDVKVDFERPNAAYGFAQSYDDPKPVRSDAKAKQDKINAEAASIAKVAGVERKPISAPETDEDEFELAQVAALTEAAWFVEVECSTTLDLVDFLVQPHMIVDVQNATPGLSGAYQVMTATHVINASDHFIDFKLRANGLPDPKKKG
jgi:hypothetical protein